MVPFVVMTLVWALRRFSQPDELSGRFARMLGFAVGWFLVATVAVRAFLYPEWTGEEIPSVYRRNCIAPSIGG